MVNPDYDQGPSKLICDDFSPANVIVKSQDDLTIVGMVELEWVYGGPAQLFASAPWWLLFDRSINEDWDFVDEKPPEVTPRYLKHLEMFKRILDEEEGRISEPHENELSLTGLLSPLFASRALHRKGHFIRGYSPAGLWLSGV
ncbi:hypothetical protein N7517_008864 [Penicillium concentricum]|uniref:Aminoglycoside phosphotransferase domain-containing protein n=1 Tax=Penicillium concentricum TaxID=293559 RepID=A0A9W9V229_9EURO|nr:uncharacterized protein N7517_008864 [Penicillium concentricum]KAJ5365978.1 hypothetical protein N7517_008864 [Penicillium concentricum]